MSAKLDLTFNGQSLGNGQYGSNNGIPIGMPYAWTHGATMSTNGYEAADSGQYCYIGFPSGSAALDQIVDSENYPSVKYYDWVQSFFNYTLYYDLTVNQALDHASYLRFPPSDFGSTALYTGFISIWPGCNPEEWPDCTLAVYGNGNLKLYQPLVTLSARDDSNNQLYPTFYVDGQAVGTGSIRVTPGTHTFDASSLYDYSFHYFYFDYGSSTHSAYYQPVNQPIPSDCDLTVHYDYTPQPPPPPELTVLAIDNYGQPGNVPLYIDSQYIGTTGYSYDVSAENHTIAVASPIYSGGQLHVWVAYYYDGNYYYDNPITVDVAEDKTVYALYWTYW